MYDVSKGAVVLIENAHRALFNTMLLVYVY